MKELIEKDYQELLVKFNDDKHLKKIVYFFNNKSILNYFIKQLMHTFNLPKLDKKFFTIEKAARIPLLTQRLLANEKTNVQEIESISSKYQIPDSKIINYEAEIIKDFDLTEAEINKYFSFDMSYGLIANAYSIPFQNSTNYEQIKQFFYYLTMYINLELSFNKFVILDHNEPFLVKLDLQVKMIRLLALIDKENYNKMIRKLNSWFNKKALYEAMRELSKIEKGKGK